MKSRLFTLFVFFGAVFACSDDDNSIELSDGNFLIFGHFYGECFGEGCVETYKLTDTKLFEDVLDEYSGANQEFIELDNDLFELVKDLPEFFPSQLLVENEAILGCPDCADGGGLFIQLSRNGSIKSWRIDQFKGNVPDYLHDFIDKVNEKIKLINN